MQEPTYWALRSKLRAQNTRSKLCSKLREVTLSPEHGQIWEKTATTCFYADFWWQDITGARFGTFEMFNTWNDMLKISICQQMIFVALYNLTSFAAPWMYNHIDKMNTAKPQQKLRCYCLPVQELVIERLWPLSDPWSSMSRISFHKLLYLVIGILDMNLRSIL